MKSVPQHILWPAIIILLLLSNIGIAVGTLVISRSDGGAQVVPEYYSAAVAWDSVSTSSQQFSDLEWKVEIAPSRETQSLAVTIADRNSRPVSGLDITLTLGQPHRSSPVGNFTMHMVRPGFYQVTEVPYRGHGLYDVELAIASDSLKTRTRRRIEIL